MLLHKRDSLIVKVKNLEKQKKIFKKDETIKVMYEITNKNLEKYYLSTEVDNTIQLLSKENQEISCEVKEFKVEFTARKDGNSLVEITIFSGTENTDSQIVKKLYIYTYTVDNMTFIDFNSFEEAQDSYNTWLLQCGRINLKEYKKIQEEKSILTEEEAEINNEISFNKARSSSSNITVSGKVQWMDSKGRKHPANEIRVEIWDKDTTSDDHITTVYTDSSGNYSASFKNDTSI